jgi:hypothetical protein
MNIAVANVSQLRVTACGLYCEMLLEDYMDRVSDRLLSETSTSEMAIDGRRRPCTTRSDIKRLVYISHSSPY